MLAKEKIEKLVDDHLNGTDKFLVEVVVSSTNVIDVFVDGDQGITISDCVKISRFIEEKLNRDTEDFELRVSSPGLSRPFKMLRQYRRYLGKGIIVELADGSKLQGVLSQVDENEIKMELKQGKKKELKKETIPFDQIEAAKPQISFK
ncbi:MAG: ribosome assembly cofactor RimP [Bacteroidales bacterium]|nr:ribosome assembly cofactor RimP [Bacteroidales bacterium]